MLNIVQLSQNFMNEKGMMTEFSSMQYKVGLLFRELFWVRFKWIPTELLSCGYLYGYPIHIIGYPDIGTSSRPNVALKGLKMILLLRNPWIWGEIVASLYTKLVWKTYCCSTKLRKIVLPNDRFLQNSDTILFFQLSHAGFVFLSPHRYIEMV